MYEEQNQVVRASGGVVTTQPGVPGEKLPGDNWMPIPHGVIPNCPPGLEYLTMIDQLLEQSGWLARQCCGSFRSFDIRVLDNYQQEVIHIRRPPDCDSCCFRCGFQKIEVYSPPGQLVGSIKDVGGWCGSWCHEKYAIMDAYDNVVLRMKWPVLRCKGSCCGDINGAAKEVFTTADNFSVSFPMDLDVKIKAVMIGACFLI
ncbi:hypothetical protein B566_EDAN010088, partial [Ephemera danica]